MPTRGRGGQSAAPARGTGFGNAGSRGFVPRGAGAGGGAGASAGATGRGFRGGQSAAFSMKRKGEFDNGGGAKRRPTGGRGAGRGGWSSRGASTATYQQNWTTENFAEDTYS